MLVKWMNGCWMRTLPRCGLFLIICKYFQSLPSWKSQYHCYLLLQRWATKAGGCSVVLDPCRMDSHGPDRWERTPRRAEGHGLCRSWSTICPWWTNTWAAKEKWEKQQEVHRGGGGWGPGDSSGVAGSCGLTCRAGYASASPLSGVAYPDSFESFQGLTIVMTTTGEYLCGALYRLSSTRSAILSGHSSPRYRRGTYNRKGN